MTNKHRRHILVLPEDDANRQIANGFLNNLDTRDIQVLKIANGWKKAVDQLTDDHAPKMRQYPDRMIVLLIDFDARKNRLSYVRGKIPQDLQDRVFVLGSWTAPEELKRDMRMDLEKIGESLAKDCSENPDDPWGHALLKHNKAELKRMRLFVKPFLFI